MASDVELFGVELVGFNAENGRKLLLTLAALALLWALGRLHTVGIGALGKAALEEMERRYFVKARDRYRAAGIRVASATLELVGR